LDVTKRDLEALSRARLEEAVELHASGKYSGAYYLASYSVELALKACIAGGFRAGVLPDNRFVQKIYSHNLEELLGLAGLSEAFRSDRAANPALAGSWGVVKDWNEQSRYQLWDAVSAAVLIEAIKDEQSGVLTWLKKHF
jgi:hypothetical protein